MYTYNPFLTSIVTFFFLFTTRQCQCQEDHKYSMCSRPYNCGIKDIKYPFWGENRPRYSGSDDTFELKCLDNHYPSIQVGSQNFTILDINPTLYHVKMVQTDIINYDNCSSDFTNTSLNSSLFQYLPTVHNITIFYDCLPGFSNGQNNFTCRGDTGKHAFYVDENLLQQFPGLVSNRGASVQVPISWGVSLDPNGGIAALKSDLSYGFEVLV